jgi:L-threonylcarbamoyladenylate synthase
MTPLLHTLRIPVDENTCDREIIQQVVRIMKSGGIVCVPFETVYGLSVDPWHREAVERLGQVKKRKAGKGFILVFSDVDLLLPYVTVENEYTNTLMTHFWPGPLTLVLKARRDVPSWISTGGKLALRLASNRIAHALADYMRGPMVSTSANVSGAGGSITPDRIMKSFSGRIDILLDSGPLTPSLPSTVVDCTERQPHILRAGAVPSSQIHEVIRQSG